MPTLPLKISSKITLHRSTGGAKTSRIHQIRTHRRGGRTSRLHRIFVAELKVVSEEANKPLAGKGITARLSSGQRRLSLAETFEGFREDILGDEGLMFLLLTKITYLQLPNQFQISGYFNHCLTHPQISISLYM